MVLEALGFGSALFKKMRLVDSFVLLQIFFFSFLFWLNVPVGFAKARDGGKGWADSPVLISDALDFITFIIYS